MPDPRPDGPRYLHDRDPHKADTTAAVDVTELLARLTERTEKLAEARVQQKHAEAELKRKTREVTTERKAHKETREHLEDDCRALEAECDLLLAQSRGLEAELAQEQDAHTAAEVDLKRVHERTAALQDRLKMAWAQLRQSESEAAEELPWWRRLG